MQQQQKQKQNKTFLLSIWLHKSLTMTCNWPIFMSTIWSRSKRLRPYVGKPTWKLKKTKFQNISSSADLNEKRIDYNVGNGRGLLRDRLFRLQLRSHLTRYFSQGALCLALTQNRLNQPNRMNLSFKMSGLLVIGLTLDRRNSPSSRTEPKMLSMSWPTRRRFPSS